MSLTNQSRETSPNRQVAGLATPQAAFLVAAGAIFAGIAWLSLHWPAALLLPVASVGLLAAAGAVAFVAYRRPEPQAGRVTYWDVTGALTLAGICAALFSEPDQVIPLIESASRPQAAEQ
jgi:hypothetical protein